MIYYKLFTNNFFGKIRNQSSDEETIIESLEYCYQNYAFSTFPYIFHNMNSYQAIKNFNSGNCVGLSISIKIYFKIKSPLSRSITLSTLIRLQCLKLYLYECSIGLPR